LRRKKKLIIVFVIHYGTNSRSVPVSGIKALVGGIKKIRTMTGTVE